MNTPVQTILKDRHDVRFTQSLLLVPQAAGTKEPGLNKAMAVLRKSTLDCMASLSQDT